MTTLTVDIENDKDLPVLKEILTRFGLNYRVNGTSALNEDSENLYKKFKNSFAEIKDWEAGKGTLQDAREAVDQIKAELSNGL